MADRSQPPSSMVRTCHALLLLLALAGCAAGPQLQVPPSPCAAGEASYACQVERYHNVAQ